jgi:flagellar assembly factor FliW
MSRTASPVAPASTQRISTPFGDHDIEASDIVEFPEGLPGFEQCRRFVVLSSNDTAPVKCLHALDGTKASFLAVDPRLVQRGYRCALSEQDRRRLGAERDDALLWLALVTLGDDTVPSVNLRAPVVINPGRMVGFQTMPHDSLYPLRHPLVVD